MNAKQEMKAVRNYCRKLVKDCETDWSREYKNYKGEICSHKSWCNRLEINFVKWDVRNHQVLVRVRDKKYPIRLWNTPYCRYVWVYTSLNAKFVRYHIWEAANTVACSFDTEFEVEKTPN